MEKESTELQGSIELGSKKFKLTKANELVKELAGKPRPEIIWNGIFRGSKGLITGIAKTGKTTFAENLAICIAVGKKDYLGLPLNGKPEKVLFVNLEETAQFRTWRAVEQIEMLSVEERELYNENYISIPENFPHFLSGDDDFNLLREYIIESGAEIIFIDSLTHIFEGKIEVTVDSKRFIERFRKYICSLGKTIVVIHHNIKGNDKPMTQDNVSGSRMIAQEFEYAIGLAGVPTDEKTSYMCNIFNKYTPKNDVTVALYSINENKWIEYKGEANKFSLYDNPITAKIDNRTNTTNKELIYQYIYATAIQDNQGIQDSLDNVDFEFVITKSSDLQNKFVSNNTMSSETMYRWLKILVAEKKIEIPTKGSYQPVKSLKNA